MITLFVDQLNALSNIDLGHIFCAASGIGEIPVDIFNTFSPGYTFAMSYLVFRTIIFYFITML